MNKNLRTFIAIRIKADVGLLSLIKNCKDFFDGEDIKWVEENNFHLTLKFLGETSPTQVQEVKEILKNLGAQNQSFSFHLNGLGYFKMKGQPRVLFVETSDFEPMKKVTDELEDRLSAIGFEKETRAFKPHLTLARMKFMKDKKRFYQFVDNRNSSLFQTIHVAEIVYYQSILQQEGPKYVPLSVVRLTGKH